MIFKSFVVPSFCMLHFEKSSNMAKNTEKPCSTCLKATALPTPENLIILIIPERRGKANPIAICPISIKSMTYFFSEYIRPLKARLTRIFQICGTRNSIANKIWITFLSLDLNLIAWMDLKITFKNDLI